MAKFEFTYYILKNGNRVFESTSQISLTKKDISELETFVIEHNYSPEFVDIPTRIYDKCFEKAYETASIEYPELLDSSNINGGIDIDLEEFIPISFIKLLSESTQNVFLSQSPYYVIDFVDCTDKNDIGEETLAKTSTISKAEKKLVQEESNQEYKSDQLLSSCDSVELCSEHVLDNKVEQAVAPCKDNTLYLPIKQIYFDQIVAGTKKQEFREIKPTTYTRYLECDKDGNPYYDLSLMDKNTPLNDDIIVWNNGVYPLYPKKYKFLNLAVGYKKERDTAIVEIEDVSFEPILDELGKPCRFTLQDDQFQKCETGEYCLWQIVYHLGKVTNVHRADKKIVVKKEKFG